jgi:2-dehydro-3-deoxy-D-arabinonate dehydratase
MILTRHATSAGPRWAADDRFLPPSFTLTLLLQLPAAQIAAFLSSVVTDEDARGPLLAPIDADQEVWAAGVTYLRSREARQAESASADVYQRVYEADRPELFFKAAGWRVQGPGAPIRIRRDSAWNVPEPEATVVVNSRGNIIGYAAGNDVSSRDIEGANPLYLPQAKVYNGSCALGSGVVLASEAELANLPISLGISRGGSSVFSGETDTSRMRRNPPELARYLCAELDFPAGVFLMTGTGIVPPESFSLQVGDVVRIVVGDQVLENPVTS